MIISNLLANALKFTPAGNTVTLTTRKEEGYIRILITDEGVGLNEEDMKHLFVRFYQGRNSKEGSGIGLSYVKVLVELQGGRINAYNNEKAGATFYVDLPEKKNEISPEQSVNISLNDILRFSEKEKPETKEEDETFDTKNYSKMGIRDRVCKTHQICISGHYAIAHYRIIFNSHALHIINNSMVSKLIINQILTLFLIALPVRN